MTKIQEKKVFMSFNRTNLMIITKPYCDIIIAIVVF